MFLRFLHIISYEKVGKTKTFDKLMLNFYEVTTDFIFLKKILPGQSYPGTGITLSQ